MRIELVALLVGLLGGHGSGHTTRYAKRWGGGGVLMRCAGLFSQVQVAECNDAMYVEACDAPRFRCAQLTKRPH